MAPMPGGQYIDRRLIRVANELANEPRTVGPSNQSMPAAAPPTVPDSGKHPSTSRIDKGKQKESLVYHSIQPFAESSSSSSALTHAAIPVIKTERVGALGIPIASDEDETGNETSAEASSVEPHSDMSSLEAHAPADLPGPSTTKTISSSSASAVSRRGPSTTISDEGFRGIVDDLTRENQTLKRKLNQYEAKIPSRLRDERLFEVRFFEGLPKSKRKELEAFLTTYVQSFHSGETPSALPPLPGLDPLTETGTTSSLGVSLTSFRSSQREAMQDAQQEAQAGRSWSDGAATSGSRHASDVMSPSASGGSADNASSKESRKHRRDRPKHHAVIGSASPRSHVAGSSSSALMDRSRLAHPPAILPRSMSPLTAERDYLSGPSFFGVEPLSTTGTGAGMRMSQRRNRKQREISTLEELDPPIRTSPPVSGGRTSGEGSESDKDQRDPEELAALVVSMLEHLFEESFPVLSEDGKRIVQTHENALMHTEPTPLPPQSSSNPAYLHALRTSTDTVENGGWIYLNLLLTMAAVHRLNVSISFVRNAIRTRSKMIELNEDGKKARWVGATVRTQRKPSETDEADERHLTENVARSRQQRADQQEAEDAAAEHETRSVGPGSSENDTRQQLSAFDTSTKPSTKATSTNPSGHSNSNNSKNDSNSVSVSATASNTQTHSLTHSGSLANTHSHSGQSGSKATGTSSGKSNRSRESNLQGSSLKNSASANGSHSLADQEEPGAATAVHGASKNNGEAPAAAASSLRKSPSPVLKDSRLYIPIFPQSRDSESDDSSADGHDRKRRRVAHGGLTFFKSDSFLSDLAGDAAVRERLFAEEQAKRETAAASVAMDVDQPHGREVSSPASMKKLSVSPVLKPVRAGDRRSVSPTSPRPAMRPLFSRTRSFSIAESIPGEEVVTELVMIGDDDERAHDPEELRIVPLQLSAMTDATPADHFTLVVTTEHATSKRAETAFSSRKRVTEPLQDRHPPKRQLYTILGSNTLLHLPAQLVRVPRVRLELDESDDDEEEGGGNDESEEALRRKTSNKRHSLGAGPDYNLSLSLPLHAWAPETRRSDSDESESEGL